MPLVKDVGHSSFVGLGRDHIVLDGNPAALIQRDTVPNFRSMSIMAKRSQLLLNICERLQELSC